MGSMKVKEYSLQGQIFVVVCNVIKKKKVTSIPDSFVFNNMVINKTPF